MKKYIPYISTLLLTFVLVFAVSGFLFPQTTYAKYNCFGIPGDGETPKPPNMTPAQCLRANGGLGSSVNLPTSITEPAQKALRFGAEIILAPVGWLALLILQIATLLTDLSGMILNYAVQFTIVDMSKNLKEIGAIDKAWKAIRDVANMGFIFILLYAAIRTILGIGDDVKKLIVHIVIVAVLINFSLFFTKVVIDSSNILSTLFYDVIAPTSLSDPGLNVGLSGMLMKPLKLGTLWKDIGVFTTERNIIIGVMGTIVSLLTAFVFFAVAIMLVIRFVVLIFVLILSPLAFMGYILPQLKKHKDDWMEALLGQAFFAPIYFMLTWIIITISAGLMASPAGQIINSGSLATAFQGAVGSDGNTVTHPPLSSIALLLNFIIMIVFLIASLIIAKQWANRAGHGVPGLTKWATGLAGGATIGMAGRFGRGTVGRAGQAVADSKWLKDRAPDSRMARLALAAGKRTGAASFDARGTPLGGTLEAGKVSGKGGYRAERESKIKKRMEFAQDIQNTVTGADVEREMEQRGYGKAENIRLGRTAAEVEAERRDAQALLVRGAEQYTAVRRERYLHNLSQTRFITPNLYSGVSEDAEAARRMRTTKTAAQQQAQATADAIAEALKQAGIGGTQSTP